MSRGEGGEAVQQVRLGYFGKLPARSDFVKSPDTLALAEILDRWLAATMTRLTANPRWKLHYDAVAPLHFAFLATRSRHAAAGWLAASGDQSGRRFPFVAVGALEAPDSPAWLPHAPLALAPLWDALASGAHAASGAAAPALAQVLGELAGASVEIRPGSVRHRQALASYLDRTTLAGLGAALAQDRGRIPVRQAFLALGLLLQPFRWSGSTRLEKSLALPLPRDSAQRPLVAALWLSLAMPFLRDADVELALFITATPQLVIGFSGPAPSTLHGVLDPDYAAVQQITFEQLDWVEDAAEPHVLRLSACLAQDRLTLKTACALFHEAFA